MTTEFPEIPVYSIASGLLDYASLSIPYPLQASAPSGELTPAEMNFVVSAPPGDPVICTKLVVEIPVGDSAQSLVETADGITATPPTGWQKQISATDSTASVTLTPPGNAFEFDQDGVEFGLAGLRLNRTPGNVTIRIMEHLATGTPERVPLDITKQPYRPPVPAGSPNRFSARRWTGTGSLNPSPATQVTAGRKVTLAWQARDGVERHLFTQPLDADLDATGQDVSRLTSVDSEPLVRATAFTLRTKVIATGETMYDTLTVTVDSPTFAGLSMNGPITGRAGGSVAFPEEVTVTKGLIVQGVVTASGGLTALGTFKAKQELTVQQGVNVNGSATAGGTSTVAGGEVTAAGIATKNLTAKKTVRIFGTIGRYTGAGAPPPSNTDRLYLGYLINYSAMNSRRVTLTVADREVGAVAHHREPVTDALFMPVRAGETPTLKSDHPQGPFVQTMYFAVAMLGTRGSS